jgi:gluconate 2-dehydrogenase alpha chain
MPREMPHVDVVIIGMGWTGSIAARELADTGLRIVGFERGGYRDTIPDFAAPQALDEIKWNSRGEIFQNLARETLTFRNKPDETALPMRRLGAFLLGEGLGGAGLHWNGQHWRFQPADFQMRSHNEQRYGKNFIDPELTIQDWGVTYDELEPYYDKFEYVCGTSGKAGNLKGAVQEGGNPFEAPRSREYPTPPLKQGLGPRLFAEGARSLGYKPFPQPASNMSQDSYTTPDGVQMGPCTYCGFCERYGCYNWSKATPFNTVLPVALKNPNFELRCDSHVTRIELTPDRKAARGVTYFDIAGRETFQPADLVLLCAFQMHNVRLMLVSGIGQPYDPATGQGVVGKNFAYQTMSYTYPFYAAKRMNAYAGAGAMGMTIDEFNADNFDHGPHGFIGGGYILGTTTGARPIQQTVLPDGTPSWGSGWKKALHDWYDRSYTIQAHGGSTARRTNYIDLDPTYRDAYGMPLLRVTFDFPRNDLKMRQFLTDRITEIARATNPTHVKISLPPVPFSIVPYQTTHTTGGAIIGTDRVTSAANTYLQSWDVPNVFIHGASAFPQNAGYNPTNTVAALSYRSLEVVKSKYLKNPGQLI